MSKMDTKDEKKAAPAKRSLYGPLPEVLTGEKALSLTKEQLLNQLNELPYAQRSQAAALVGSRSAKNPKLAQLITQLRTHPAPRAPVQEAEEGVSELLPAQKKNTAKFYNEDAFALIAATHSKQHLALLKDELKGPSKLFTQMMITNIVKQEKDDAALAALVQGSSPKVYRKFVASLLRFRRTRVCEALFPYAMSRYGVDSAARLLHGCSDPFVADKLKNDTVRNSSGLKWRLLAKSHPKVVVPLIRADVQSMPGFRRAEAWQKWETERLAGVMDALVTQAGAFPDVWKIVEEFPLWVWDFHTPVPAFEDAKGFENVRMRKTLPQWVNRHFELILARYPKSLLAFAHSALYVRPEQQSADGRRTDRSDSVNGGLDALLTAHYSTPQKFDGQLVPYLQKVLATATRKTFYQRHPHGSSFEHDALGAIGSMLKAHSVVQGKKLVSLFAKFLDDMKPDSKDEKKKPDTKSDTQKKQDKKSSDEKDSKQQKQQKKESAGRRARDKEDEGAASDEEPEPERVVDTTRRDEWDEYNLNWDLKGPNGEPVCEWDTWRQKAVSFWTSVLEVYSVQYQLARNPLLGRARDVRERALRAAKAPNPLKAQALHTELMAAVQRLCDLIHHSYFDANRQLTALAEYELSSVSSKTTANRENIVRYALLKLDAYPLPVARMTLYNSYSPLQVKSLTQAYAQSSAKAVTFFSASVRTSLTAAFGYLKGRATVSQRLALDTAGAAAFGAASTTTTSVGASAGAAAAATTGSALSAPPVFHSVSDAKLQSEVSGYLQQVSEVFNAIHQTEPMRWTEDVCTFLPYLSRPVLLQIWARYSPAQYQELARARTAQLMQLLAAVGRPTIDPVIAQLLEPDAVSIDVRDQLVGYQPVENKAVWKEMTKASDSNNVSERNQAFKALFEACMAHSGNDYLKRALELVRRKIKNESVENRESILALWCGDVSRSDRAGRQNLQGAEYDKYHKSWTESGRLVSLELLPLWSQMLEDALESQDLDLNTNDRTPKMINNNKDMDYSHLSKTHYVLKHFHNISVLALRRGAALRPNTHDAQLFDFGVELQWRMAQFRLGERSAAQYFRIDFGASLSSRAQLTAEPGSNAYRSAFPNTVGGKLRRGYGGNGSALPEVASDKERNHAVVELPVEAEPRFLAAVLKAYTERVVPHFADAFTKRPQSNHIFRGVLDVIGRNAVVLPATRAYLESLLTAVKTEPLKDAEGLPIIEADHDAIVVFEKLMRLYEPWWRVDLLRAYHDTLLRTRQARRVFWPWVHSQSNCQLIRKRDKKFLRDAVVNQVLTVSASAIHIRFVWRHLARYHQNKLNPYLFPQSTFRGVFYLSPQQRGKLATGVVAPVAAPARRAGRGRGGARGGRGGGRARPVAALAPGTGSKQSLAQFQSLTPSKVEEAIKRDVEAEKTLEDERKEKGTTDFPENFTLPICFGLHRLLPAQCEVLAKQRLATALNPNRPIPDRVKAMILWTLLPTVTYADVVEFVDQQTEIAKNIKALEKAAKDPEENKKEDADSKDSKGKGKGKGKADDAKAAEAKKAADAKKEAEAKAKAAAPQKTEEQLRAEREARATAKLAAIKARKELFPVNLLEACIKGVMYNDEVLAPLSWLLSPKFLGSDQARVAIYSIASFLPYMQPDALTQLLKIVLTGKRRQNLKVTAYKEVIRLLEAAPTPTHLAMIENEWKRDLLHRDVRIVILNAAVGFFRLPGGRGIPTAWSILHSAVRSSNVEIQVALLGPTPSKADEMPGLHARTRSRQQELLFTGDGLVANRRLLEHLESRNLRKVTVPAGELCEKYAQTVILKLCAPDVDDDVRHLAIFCLADWLNAGGPSVAKDAAHLYQRIAMDTRPTVTLCNPKPALRSVWHARFSEAVKLLYKICNVTERNTYNVSNKLVGDLIRALLAECAKYSAPKSGLERDARRVLFSRASQLLSSLPREGYRTYFTPTEEKEWVGLFKAFSAPAGVWWRDTMQRRNAQLNRLDWGGEFTHSEAKAYGEELIKFLQELFDGAITGDLMTPEEAVSEAKQLLQRHTSMYRKEANTIQKMLVDRLLKVTNDSYTASISDSKQSREVDLNRYVSVFRTTTLHALQVFPTTIADSIAALRQFIKQTVHCYAVQQWPTFGADDVAKMVSNLLVATIKQYTFTQSSEPLLRLDEFSTALIRDLFEATAASAVAANPGSLPGAAAATTGSAGSAGSKAAAGSNPAQAQVQAIVFAVNRAVALDLLEKHPEFVVLAGVRVCDAVNWLVADSAVRAHESATYNRLRSVVLNLIEEVQSLEVKRARHGYSDAKPTKPASETYTKATVHIIRHVLRGTLAKADPIPFTNVKVNEWNSGDSKGAQFRAVPSEMHSTLQFQLAMDVLSRFKDVALHSELNADVFALVHEAVLYMTLHPAARVHFLDELARTLSAAIQAQNITCHDLEQTLTAHGGGAWGILRSYVYGLTNSATTEHLPVFPAKPIATAFFGYAVGVASRPSLAKLQESHSYRNLSGQLALQLLRTFADATTLTEEVMPPVEEEPKKPEAKDVKMEDGEEEEEDEEKEKKKKKKKPVPEVYQVYRPEVLPLVDLLSAHSDALIRHAALNLDIRRRV